MCTQADLFATPSLSPSDNNQVVSRRTRAPRLARSSHEVVHQAPLPLELAPDTSSAYKAALEALCAKPGQLIRFLRDGSRSRAKLSPAIVEEIAHTEKLEAAYYASRLPLPAASLPELLALPELPGWLPGWRAREAVLEGESKLIEHLYPHLVELASKRRTQRKGMTQDDLLSAMTTAARNEICRWDPNRASPSRKAKGLSAMPVVEGVKSFLTRKLANGSIERDWMGGATRDQRTDSIDEANSLTGVSLADSMDSGQASPYDILEASEQGRKVIEVLRKSPTDVSRAAEAYLIRELGITDMKGRKIVGPSKKRLKSIAGGEVATKGQTLESVIEEIKRAGRVIENKSTILESRLGSREPEYKRLARLSGLI